jgi:acetate kinase
MILLFDPQPPALRWHLADEEMKTAAQGEAGPEECGPIAARAARQGRLDAVGYLLYHGGEKIQAPVGRLTPESLPQLAAATVGYLPERNELTFAAAREGLAALPGGAHFLLCDTAFFTGLPAAASTYAIPHPLRQQGLKRYGGFGLCHQWVWEQVRARGLSPAGRLISVYLGNNTNLAAIEGGEPRETTIGFTGVEGILSATRCGDLDPTIALHLRASGMSFTQINRLLSRESGFAGLLGRPCGLREILTAGGDPEVAAVREIFRYSVSKYVGAFAAVLGGVEAVAFASEEPERGAGFAQEICRRLDRLLAAGGGRAGDRLQVHTFSYDKAAIMAARIGHFLQQGGR